MVEKVRMSAEEFLDLPETTTPMELIEGEMIVTPAPEDMHQKSSGKFFVWLSQHATEGELRYAPADVRLSAGTVVQPDIFWVSPESACQLVDGKYWQGAPDLVIEILSPSTARRDRGIKFDLYQQHGVREYWIAEPEQKYVEVYAREGERLMRVGLFSPGDTFTSPVLGGLSVDVNQLFGLPAEQES